PPLSQRRCDVPAPPAPTDIPTLSLHDALPILKNAYDPEYGGFGGAPKFPQTDAILLLLEQSALRGDEELRRMAVHTLEQMAGGRSEEHTSELQSRFDLVCRLLLEKKKYRAQPQ